MAHLFAAVLTAISLLAVDVTGTWTGTLTPDGGDPSSALLVLQQEGTTITGTAGSNETNRYPIRNGALKGEALTFDIELPNGVMKFDLKVNGDELAGAVVREREGEQQKATLSVKRTK